MIQSHRDRDFSLASRLSQRAARGFALLLALLWLVHLCPAAQEFIPAAPGLDYQHRVLEQKPWSIHVARIAWRRPDLQVVSSLARNRVFGLSSVPEQVESWPTTRGQVLAAVNGDFFVIRPGPYQGDPLGLHIRDGELVSAPNGGPCFWITPRGAPRIGTVLPRLRVIWPDGTKTRIGLNEARGDEEAVLFTPTFGFSTHTLGGTEIVLEPAPGSPWLPLRVGQEYRARIAAIRQEGNTSLTTNRMVLSLGRRLAARLTKPQVGETLRLAIETSPDLRDVPTAIGGGPLLVDHGKTASWRNPTARHPRTAVGWNASYLFLVEVDGRQPKLSIGMTYPELAALFQELNCQQAMNLDGGGSSTFWLLGAVKNSPSDGAPRRVANALLIIRSSRPKTR